MNLSSPVFESGQSIPTPYTQFGQDSSPGLIITDVPAETKNLVLIVDDPDAPHGTFTHWVVFNIDPDTKTILDNTVPPGSTQGQNGSGKVGYLGPKPPSGTHRYFFRLYALKERLTLEEGADRDAVEKTMAGYVIDQAELLGLYGAEPSEVEAGR